MKQLTLISKEPKEYLKVVEFLHDAVDDGHFHHFKRLNDGYYEHLFDAGAMALASTDDNGNITGVLVFFISDLLPTFPGIRVALEHVWFSKGGTGKQLYDAFEQHAKDLGCKHIIMSCHHGNSMADKVQSYFKSKGYAPCETTFIKELI